VKRGEGLLACPLQLAGTVATVQLLRHTEVPEGSSFWT
jgi:hypothetical protein